MKAIFAFFFFAIAMLPAYATQEPNPYDEAARLVVAQKSETAEEPTPPSLLEKASVGLAVGGIAAVLVLVYRVRRFVAFMPKRAAVLIARRSDTRIKRLALLASPFFLVATLHHLVTDLDNYNWWPSLHFLVFSMATILCLLVALTRMGNWISKP